MKGVNAVKKLLCGAVLLLCMLFTLCTALGDYS